MTDRWFKDMQVMHTNYQVTEWIRKNKHDKELMRKFLEFRIKFLEEELNETKAAFENNDPEEIVDGLIDLCVIAIGTLDAFNVDSEKAWNEVYKANLAKTPGVKESRPNPLGLPDLIKPDGWEAPSHKGNHGLLSDII